MAQLRAAAVAPVHAYLLVGPEGRGARTLARAFAADLLAAGLDGDAADRARRLALAEHHADLVIVEPSGNVLRDEEVEHLVIEASRSPIEGNRKVLVVTRFHTATDKAFAQLLKPIEEPPNTAVFVLLADDLEPRLDTIASRCVVIGLDPVPESELAALLETRGLDADSAARVAAVAGGDLDRAALLAGDERLALRIDAWRQVPAQLEGSGHVVWRLVSELQASIGDALAHVEARQADDQAALAAQVEDFGLPRGRLKDLADAQKRELRRARTAELRLGLATLAARYRDALAEATPTARRDHLAALAAIDEATENLVVRNPNEALLLQALLLRLPPLA